MTADVELLPLPEPEFLARRATSGEWLELLDANDWTAEMWVHGTDPVYSADQLRACVAHHTAAKDAEIEALRAEVARLRRSLHEAVVHGNRQSGRAERLAEAAEKVLVAASARNVLAMFQAAEALSAALHPTAAQETDRD